MKKLLQTIKNKKQFLVFCVFAFIGLSTNAQHTAPTLPGTFVQGINPVNNTFVFTDPNSTTATQADFYSVDGTTGNAVFISTDNTSTTTFTSATCDMGNLPPNSYIRVDVTDATNGNYQDSTSTLSILPTPQWLAGGSGNTATNVTLVGNIITFDAILNLSSSNSNLPDSVTGIGGRSYNIVNPSFIINVSYDITAPPSSSVFNSQSVGFTLDVFNSQFTHNFSQPINTTSISLDANFNFQVLASITQNIAGFKINFPAVRFPMAPLPIVIKVDGGMEISTDIIAEVNFGYDGSNWGFIQTGTDVTKVIGKINGDAFLRVTADAVIASASGTLGIKGSIGGGLSYTTASGVNPLFGGELEIYGKLNYKIGRGWFTLHEGEISKTFYHKEFGDTAALRMPYGSHLIWEQPHVDAMGGYTRLIQTNPGLEPQAFYAQPSFSANDSTLYITWLDYDSNDKTMILLSQFDYTTGQFSTPVSVIDNQDIIENPKAAILPSGSCILSWTQGRLTALDTATMDMRTVAKSQDIWLAYYDKPTNTVSAPIMLSDNTAASDTSGRAEGNANIIMGKGNYGIITWIASDLANNTSDVYYSTITLTGSTITFSPPAIFITEPGIDRSVNVAFYDSTHVIASWINDPDGTDSTANNVVMYQEFDITVPQGSWAPDAILINTDNSTQYEDLSMDFNGQYGAIAYTSTHYETDGKFEKNINAVAWSGGAWSTPYIDSDTSYYFLKPHVSVNNAGVTALTYQAIQLVGDTLNPDQGVMYMFTNDINNSSTVWTSYQDSLTLGDPNIYDEDIQTTYSHNNYLLAITQESDPVTGMAPINPPNGVRFGSLDLNLVLRAFNVNGISAPADTTEPATGTTLNIKQSQSALGDLLIFPNPTSDVINLRFSNEKRTNIKIELFDINGRLVSTIMNTVVEPGLYQTVYEPARIDNGLYIIKITTDKGVSNSKVSIIK